MIWLLPVFQRHLWTLNPLQFILQPINILVFPEIDTQTQVFALVDLFPKKALPQPTLPSPCTSVSALRPLP